MSLQLKTFHANSVEQAMAAARKELGPDAMLVHSQRSAGDAKLRGQYEVVFARPGATAPVIAKPSAPSPIAADSKPLNAELAELKQMIHSLYRLNAERQTPDHRNAEGGARPALLMQLLDLGLEQSIAVKLLEQWEDTRDSSKPATDIQAFDSYLAAYLQPLCMTVAQSKLKVPQQEVLALVGPPGAGKTTTLAKLAAQLGLKNRKTVQFLCLEGERIGAAEQLRSYARIMGAGFHLVPEPALLASTVKEFREKNMILIDTPGYSAAEREELNSSAEALAGIQEARLHLVLPATMRACDMERASNLFQPFRPEFTLFTRLDETDRLGGILNETIRSSRPVSYLGRGQCIPDDLERASADTLVSQLLPQLAARACA